MPEYRHELNITRVCSVTAQHDVTVWYRIEMLWFKRLNDVCPLCRAESLKRKQNVFNAYKIDNLQLLYL